MANPLGRLLGRRGRRRTVQDESPGDAPPVDPDALPLAAMLGQPPVLVPASIIRQPLFAATELTPAWLRPRPASVFEPLRSSSPTVDQAVVADDASAVESKRPKRTTRPKPNGSSATGPTRPRRVAKPARDATNR